MIGALFKETQIADKRVSGLQERLFRTVWTAHACAESSSLCGPYCITYASVFITYYASLHNFKIFFQNQRISYSFNL
jgi:hypothetical protein